MYKISLLITGGYRTFEENIINNEYYNFFEFDKYDYHIFFILTDDEDIELINNKKNFIKNIFGSKLKITLIWKNINTIEKENNRHRESKQ
jgi:hypothetical protein